MDSNNKTEPPKWFTWTVVAAIIVVLLAVLIPGIIWLWRVALG